MAVKKTRSIQFGDAPGLEALKISDLGDFISEVDAASVVNVKVYVNKADRPGGSDQTTVTLSVEE